MSVVRPLSIFAKLPTSQQLRGGSHNSNDDQQINYCAQERHLAMLKRTNLCEYTGPEKESAESRAAKLEMLIYGKDGMNKTSGTESKQNGEAESKQNGRTETKQNVETSTKSNGETPTKANGKPIPIERRKMIDNARASSSIQLLVRLTRRQLRTPQKKELDASLCYGIRFNVLWTPRCCEHVVCRSARCLNRLK